MALYQLDPLTDSRWEKLTCSHPASSVFHSVGWLRALQMTYGYEPVAYTLCPPGSELESAVVFCRVRSWPTRRRLVSLPFSDHCDPLVGSVEEFESILAYLLRETGRDTIKAIEVRPVGCYFGSCQLPPSFGVQQNFFLHRVDISASCDELMRSFHKNSIQRGIRRAEREKVEYQQGRSEELLRIFFSLLLKTRRKHRLPPQPIGWFRNLIDCLGNKLQIHVALGNDGPIASIMTLAWKHTLVYKYGCSDPQFNNLGGTPLLLWNAIQQAKSSGLRWFDLGRSDCDNLGLVTFKERWGALRSPLSYWCYPAPRPRAVDAGWKERLAGQLFRRMPDRLLMTAGRVLYRYMG